MIAYQPIENYGIIGNLHTVALVGINGFIDWFCFPYIDSPSVFCALLDSDKGGYLAVRPREDFDSASKYLDRTNILITRFSTRKGVMKLVDFMPVPRSGPDEKEKIHAQVCASSSCPPIEVYSAENLDEELNQAGKSFLKGGGLVLNKENKEVSLSRVFLWYGKDFGKSGSVLLSRLADFVYDHDEREFLKRHAHELTVNYQKYDWRLNRGDIPS